MTVFDKCSGLMWNMNMVLGMGNWNWCWILALIGCLNGRNSILIRALHVQSSRIVTLCHLERKLVQWSDVA